MNITTDDLPDIKTEVLRREIFKLIEVHVDLMDMDQEKYIYLLGYYPAMYNYVSELYTFMIAKVREYMELSDRFHTALARDKRDVLEQALKSIKLQYESISRKITILVPQMRE